MELGRGKIRLAAGAVCPGAPPRVTSCHEKARALFLSSLTFGLFLVAALVGCKSTGQGMGESRTGDVKASFTWEESGPSSGMLKATVKAGGLAGDL